MRLADWIAQQGVKEFRTDKSVAARLNVSAEAVRRYQLPVDHPEYQVPRREVMARIYTLTSGLVTANDFHGQPAPERQRA